MRAHRIAVPSPVAILVLATLSVATFSVAGCSLSPQSHGSGSGGGASSSGGDDGGSASDDGGGGSSSGGSGSGSGGSNGGSSSGATPDGVASIAAGSFHTCAAKSGGDVYCWGDGSSGQIGGASQQSSVPVKVDLPGKAVSVTAGANHTCALMDDATVQCWGNNMSGQLGDGTNASRSSPAPVVGLSGVTAVFSGWASDSTCAITSGGALQCWGNNIDGNLGDGSQTDRWTPVAVSGLGSGVTWASPGGNDSCALVSGQVMCWGTNGEWELGQDPGTTASSNTPVAVPNAPQSTAMFFADTWGACVGMDGSVTVWGSIDGSYGHVTPFPEFGSGVKAIAGDSGDIYALTVVGGVKAWNATHPLSDILPQTAGVTAIAGGQEHACAVTATGVVCWGANRFGELGNGGKVDSTVPIPVTGL